jgi:hypothetical protein
MQDTTVNMLASNIVNIADSLIQNEIKLSEAIKLFVSKGGNVSDVLTTVRTIDKTVISIKALRDGKLGNPKYALALTRYERINKAHQRAFPKVASTTTTSKRGTKSAAKKDNKKVSILQWKVDALNLTKINKKIIATIQKMEKPNFDAARVIAAYQVCNDQLIPKK